MENGSNLKEALDKRSDILRTLVDQPMSKPEVTNTVAVSRSTVDRAIDALQEVGCVDYTDRKYHSTLKGKMALDAYEEYTEFMETLEQSGSVLNSMAESVGVDREFIQGATTYESDPQVPELALRKSNEILESATKLVGLAPVSLSTYPDLIQNAIDENDLETEIIAERSVLSSLKRVKDQEMVRFIESENVSLFLTDQQLPYAVWVMETPTGDYAGITVYEKGGVQGVILNKRDKAVQWAKEVIEEHRELSWEVGPEEIE